MARASRYPKELLDRGVRLALEGERPIAHIAQDLGIGPETLRKRVRRAQVDAGKREGLTTNEKEELKRLRKRELRAAAGEHDLEGGVGVFRAGARSKPAVVSAFIDQVRDRFGVEPVCRTLGVSASAYYQRATGQRSERSLRHGRLIARIREVHRDNYAAYGYRRVWKALGRAGVDAGRDQVARLMRSEGLVGREAAWEAVADHQTRPWRRRAAGSGQSPVRGRAAERVVGR